MIQLREKDRLAQACKSKQYYIPENPMMSIKKHCYRYNKILLLFFVGVALFALLYLSKSKEPAFEIIIFQSDQGKIDFIMASTGKIETVFKNFEMIIDEKKFKGWEFYPKIGDSIGDNPLIQAGIHSYIHEGKVYGDLYIKSKNRFRITLLEFSPTIFQILEYNKQEKPTLNTFRDGEYRLLIVDGTERGQTLNPTNKTIEDSEQN
jgi:hypothetical protein